MNNIPICIDDKKNTGGYIDALPEKVMDHFSNPRNVGKFPTPTAWGEVGNAKCGDIMKMYLKIQNGVIEDVKFKTFGCGRPLPPAPWPPK